MVEGNDHTKLQGVIMVRIQDHLYHIEPANVSQNLFAKTQTLC